MQAGETENDYGGGGGLQAREGGLASDRVGVGHQPLDTGQM